MPVHHEFVITSLSSILAHRNIILVHNFVDKTTVPRRSIANRHSIRRLHMCANRKFSMSEQFEQAEPSYTSYHMMVETRPLYLLLRLIRASLRLQQRYHADPLLTYAANVAYICAPIANYAAACLIFYQQGLPTHRESHSRTHPRSSSCPRTLWTRQNSNSAFTTMEAAACPSPIRSLISLAATKQYA